MPSGIEYQPILPKPIKFDFIIREIESLLKREGQQQKKLLAQPTLSWEGEKPSFPPHVNMKDGNDASSATKPEGNKKGVDKYKYNNKGTSIRWAVMSPDWKSKGKVGSLKSGRGRGSPVIIGKRAMQKRNIKPRPGIKDMGWTKIATKKRRLPFQNEAKKTMRKIAKGLF